VREQADLSGEGMGCTEGMRVGSLFGVEGKLCVVTGGGRGIGAFVAEGLAANGAEVLVCGRDVAALEDTAARLRRSYGAVVHVVRADLSSEAGCVALAKEVGKVYGRVDVLVNNSGTSWGGALESYEEAAWAKVVALNVVAVFSLTRALLPLLEARRPGGDGDNAEERGAVINVGSIAGIRPQGVPTFAYDVSKAAVHHLTVKLSSELGNRWRADGTRRRVTVNALAPGYVPTRMSKGLEVFGDRESLADPITLGRLGTPEDMAGACIYLASRAGAWVTGTVLVVDGGWLANVNRMFPLQRPAARAKL